MGENSAKLDVGSKQMDLPIHSGTIGPDVADISKLYAETGMFTYDPGFTSTASCESKITYIDGDEGVLLYRGYPIEQLAEHGDFLETCYLLLYGELPTHKQKTDFDDSALFGLGTATAAPIETRISIAVESDEYETRVREIVDRALTMDPWFLTLRDPQKVIARVKVADRTG